MTFTEIQKANEQIVTVDVKGKAYAEVNQRIKAFRMCYPQGGIDTALISNENGICIFSAKVYDEDGKLLGSGTAYEKENSSFINKTSYIENCETSAVGRALGMAGFGIDVSVASAEEVQNAIKQQEDASPIDKHNIMVIERLCEDTGTDIDKLLANYKAKEIKDLTKAQANNAIGILNKKRNKK